jgi:energy-coupling factor transporter ATP-binding protein EcfA2
MVTIQEAIAKITNTMKKLRTPLGTRFVDRELEVEKIIDERERAVLGGMVNVLYGPRGCGKTTLFRALHFATEVEDVDIDILYIVKEYEEAPQYARLYIPKTLSEILREVALAVSGSVEIGYGGSGTISASITLFRAVKVAIELIAKRLRKRRKVFIVVDEVKADSEESLSNFRSWLEEFANDVGYINLDYKDRTGGSIVVVALVSDALIAEIRHVVGPKATWSFIWNLPRKALEELVEELHLNISTDTLWRLTGGNPRALQAIATQGLEKWFKEEILENIRNLYRDALEMFGNKEAVWRELEITTHNIDEARMSLLRSMLRRNIAIYIGAATPLSELPTSVPWIKEDFAYQLPAYYHTLRTMVSKKSIDVTLDNVLSIL